MQKQTQFKANKANNKANKANNKANSNPIKPKQSQFKPNQSQFLERLNNADTSYDPQHKKGQAAETACRIIIKKWAGVDLNHRHTDFQSVALPTELPDRLTCKTLKNTDLQSYVQAIYRFTKKIRQGGFEPPTFGSVDRCSIQLSY